MPALLTPQRRRIASTFRAVQNQQAARLVPRLSAFFKLQSTRVVNRYLSKELKAFKQDDDYDEEDYDDEVEDLMPEEENAALGKVLLPELLNQYMTGGQLAESILGHTTTPLNAQDKRTIAYLAMAGDRIVDINDVTRDAVRDVLVQGSKLGLNPYQVAHGIDQPTDLMVANGVPEEGLIGLDDVVDQTYKGRSDAIARTELAMASNAGALDRYQDAGMQQVQIEDGEIPTSCQECQDRDGEIYDLEDWPGLAHPNCTAVPLPVIG